MISDTNAAVGTHCPVSSCITDQIAADENIWLCECVPACVCMSFHCGPAASVQQTKPVFEPVTLHLHSVHAIF